MSARHPQEENHGDYVIRAAGKNDLPGVVEIATHWQLTEPDESDGDNGFLVSGYGLGEYEKMLLRARHFLVAVQGTQVVGFLLGYTDETIAPDERLNLQMVQELGSLVVIKQVAVLPNFARQGVARALYSRVLGDAGDKPVIAAVVSDPMNTASVRFHYAMRFEPYLSVRPRDGRERTVWLHTPTTQGMLLQQYTHAVDLYKHEDMLNWNKINNFFYITAALLAAYGVVLKSPEDSGDFPVRSVLIGVCALGLLTSIAFSISLISGVSYLARRKAVVSRIEERLVRNGGVRVVSVEHAGLGARWLRTSPTRYLLVGAPMVMCLGWITVLILSVV